MQTFYLMQDKNRNWKIHHGKVESPLSFWLINDESVKWPIHCTTLSIKCSDVSFTHALLLTFEDNKIESLMLYLSANFNNCFRKSKNRELFSIKGKRFIRHSSLNISDKIQGKSVMEQLKMVWHGICSKDLLQQGPGVEMIKHQQQLRNRWTITFLCMN